MSVISTPIRLHRQEKMVEKSFLPQTDQKLEVKNDSFLLRSTPGRYVCLMAIILLLLLCSCLISVITVVAKQNTYRNIFEHSMRLHSTALDLATSLSEMDVAMAEISVNPLKNHNFIDQLRANILKSNQAVMIIGGETGDSDPLITQNLATISSYLRNYANDAEKLLESPSAINYDAILLDATEINDKKLIPAVDYIINYSVTRLNKETSSISNIPQITLILIFISLISVILANTYISRISGHIFNIGLVVAMSLIFVQLVWLILSSIFSRYQGIQFHNLGVSNLTSFTSILNTSQQARRDELISIILPQFRETYHLRCRTELNKLATTISTTHSDSEENKILLINAGESLSHWSHFADAIYHTSQKSMTNGNFTGSIAVQPITNTEPQYFLETVINNKNSQDFEENIRRVIKNIKTTYPKHILSGYNDWGFTVTGIITIFLINFISIITAISVRLKEYR